MIKNSLSRTISSTSSSFKVRFDMEVREDKVGELAVVAVE